MVQFGMLEYTHGLCLYVKFHRNRFILSPWRSETPNFNHISNSTLCGSATERRGNKVECECTTTNLPYQMIPKPFLYSNTLMVVVFTYFIGQKYDGQSNIKYKHHFFIPWLQVKSEPHQTWHGNRGHPHHSCTLKTCSHPTYSFVTRRHKN